ncbi:MAG: hypothetical protein IJP71_04005 [Lachnospiraceae bacterium]|nr:hypothetical protein [Lachnospiraceae bacterium]
MKSNFNFKSLFKRLPNVSIPKEFIYFGIGTIIVVLIGLIVGNMYLQEMLYFEGEEKSLQMFTEEELREYGEIYKEMSLDFENEIGSLIEDYANRTNRAGEKIHYGIYNHEHPTDDTGKIKIHDNGSGKPQNYADPFGDGTEYTSEYDDTINDFRLKDSYIDSDQFKNGVTIKYAKTIGRSDGESNFKDILTAVSMIMDQNQTKNESSINIKANIPQLIKHLFKITHIYTGESTELYSCEKGCRVLFYYCNEIDNKYAGTGIDLQPFPINPHSDFEDYTDEDFEIHEPDGECPICGHKGKGCVKDSEKCLHGAYYKVKHEDSIVFECKHSVGKTPESYGCDNYEEKAFCSHFECDHENECPHDNETGVGCAGCYECKGHEHWNCPGHFYVCCMGHTDIVINIKIMYINELLDVIKNGYNVGVEDETD